jgi:hypothetical protein
VEWEDERFKHQIRCKQNTSRSDSCESIFNDEKGRMLSFGTEDAEFCPLIYYGHKSTNFENGMKFNR